MPKKRKAADMAPIGQRPADPFVGGDIEPLFIPNAIERIFRRAASKSKHSEKSNGNSTQPKN